jgi:hypothetical protein
VLQKLTELSDGSWSGAKAQQQEGAKQKRQHKRVSRKVKKLLIQVKCNEGQVQVRESNSTWLNPSPISMRGVLRRTSS